MLVVNARILIAIVGLMLISNLAAQETYSQQFNSASQRRAEASMEQFQSRLSKAKSSGDRSKSRILLSFNSLVPADGIIGKMDALGMKIEELQVAVGEEVHSFSIRHQDLHEAELSVRQQLERSIVQREREINGMLANESNERTSYWLKESLRLVDAYQAKMANSPSVLISGVGCIATNDQVESLMEASPLLIRAVEFPGTLRLMSIPIEAYRGPEE